ncbi:MAG: hypothetical protein ABIS21_06340, partial [Acidimicrobiales bacterium]
MVELEEERDFLLRSLQDLEREQEAGDLDEADYRSLRDSYTARAAAVLRAIEATGTGAPVVPTDTAPTGNQTAAADGDGPVEHLGRRRRGRAKP